MFVIGQVWYWQFWLASRWASFLAFLFWWQYSAADAGKTHFHFLKCRMSMPYGQRDVHKLYTCQSNDYNVALAYSNIV